ncbi:hypothetical protein GF312_03615 [Candidatus Poribacteria bacterium]|nr:hypothetical protein [Candidatus Poribacteria bacterium]
MNSRERVLLAINHKEPDRLPVFRPNMIPTYEPLDDRVRDFLDTFEFDRFAGVGFIKSPDVRRDLPDDMVEDGYGCKFKYKGVGSPYCVYSPLADVKTIDDVDAFDWPDPCKDEVDKERALNKAKELREKGEYATVVGIGMLFHRYQWLRGFNQWLLDMKTNPELHKAIADHIYHINSSIALRTLDVVGDYTDIVSTGDDFGTSTAPLMSPEDFKEHIKPYFKEFIGKVKSKFPHIKFYLHSHGQIMDLVPDLIDCGVDILNPILPLDNMNPAVLKEKYGHQLCFEGGIDIERVLPFETVDKVEDHVKRVIDILAPGGGFMFKAQAISYLISYENLNTTYNLALTYGRYDKN